MLTPSRDSGYSDLIVVGGGLAGLTAAALAAKAGRSVVVLERSRMFGGRAGTQVRAGVHWNLGPHALFCHGHACRLFRNLGVPFTGKSPIAGGLLLVGRQERFFLKNTASLLTTRFFSFREKWRLLRFLAGLGASDARAFDHVSLSDWLRQAMGADRLAAFLAAFIRADTYINDNDFLSAGAALSQLQLYFRGNIWYLDGGWKVLVDGLRSLTTDLGGELRTTSPAAAVRSTDVGVEVRTTDGTTLRGRSAILAVGPREACSLLDLPSDSSLAAWAGRIRPVHVASLDVALSSLPKPECRVAFGLDSPLYYSVHSAAARLAPEGLVVLHAMKYRQAQEEESADAIREQLETWLDGLQPGWRERIVQHRYLPCLTAAHAVPLASEGGLRGRPAVTAAGRPNVFLAGDWVGSDGLLADAAAASAQEAVRCALAGDLTPSRGKLSHASARSSV